MLYGFAASYGSTTSCCCLSNLKEVFFMNFKYIFVFNLFISHSSEKKKIKFLITMDTYIVTM